MYLFIHAFHYTFKKKKIIHFINPLWEIRTTLQQPQEQRYPVLHVYNKSFPVCANPPNSDMDYMVLIKRAYVIILVRAYTHAGCMGTPTESQHNIFDSERLIKFFLCS